ncbi:MAG TPA: ATP-binding protein [Methanomicrobia archaeon]|nr:ATP-binding protein [Methanomicrobia archaeon]
MKAPPEKLGSFFLGAEYDLVANNLSEIPVNYDARDLTTHAICVGMTGSGKTGLCIGILEEAALDKVPAIIIDPKGDITNLLLQFPELRQEDFRPWVNPDDARRKSMTVDQYAQHISKTWENGLSDWGIGKERIRELNESVDYTIFSPGSDAGRPINILGSLSAPRLDFNENAEAVREQIAGTVSALLGMADVKSDPVRGKESILLAHIFEHAWRRSEDLDIAKLINAIQNPPFRSLGVFDIDTFFPPAERFELAMAFNSLIAAPNFQGWLRGEPLDANAILYRADGKPRHSIFYLAHLSERERMFFVTLLLETILSWTRKQSGTTSLRALLYFDETFGFMPPVAEPPSKKPLITLLKQARAMGLGVMLVTQNPVDIDYKGLTNAGTWFIGKLQAERDKRRVLEGLRGAIAHSSGVHTEDYDAIITGLKSRVFLMHNVHNDRPLVFNTRWVMSYLRGPLTKPQVRELMKNKGDLWSEVLAEPTTPVPSSNTYSSGTLSTTQPSLDPAVPVAFMPATLLESDAIGQLRTRTGKTAIIDASRLVYVPYLLGSGSVRFKSAKMTREEREDLTFILPVSHDFSIIDWNAAERVDIDMDSLVNDVDTSDIDAAFLSVPERANSPKELNALEKEYASWLYQTRRKTLNKHQGLKLYQDAYEDERDFMARVNHAARERRDAEIEKLEKKYSATLDKLSDKLERLELELESEKAEHEARKREELAGVGESVLGFFMGRRRTSSVSSMTRKRRMTAKAKREIEKTSEEIERVKTQSRKLEIELETAIDTITVTWENAKEDIEQSEIKPKKSDVEVRMFTLAWAPSWRIDYHNEDQRGQEVIPASRAT